MLANADKVKKVVLKIKWFWLQPTRGHERKVREKKEGGRDKGRGRRTPTSMAYKETSRVML